MRFTQWVVEYAFHDYPKLWGPVIVGGRRPLIVDTKEEAMRKRKMLLLKFGNQRTYRVRKVTFGEIDCD
jgi:hypothetical protein